MWSSDRSAMRNGTPGLGLAQERSAPAMAHDLAGRFCSALLSRSWMTHVSSRRSPARGSRSSSPERYSTTTDSKVRSTVFLGQPMLPIRFSSIAGRAMDRVSITRASTGQGPKGQIPKQGRARTEVLLSCAPIEGSRPRRMLRRPPRDSEGATIRRWERSGTGQARLRLEVTSIHEGYGITELGSATRSVEEIREGLDSQLPTPVTCSVGVTLTRGEGCQHDDGTNQFAFTVREDGAGCVGGICSGGALQIGDFAASRDGDTWTIEALP